MITPEELAAMRERCERATPCPWVSHTSGNGWNEWFEIRSTQRDEVCRPAKMVDDDFIREARTDTRTNSSARRAIAISHHASSAARWRTVTRTDTHAHD